MGKESKKEWICVYMYNWFTLLYTWNWHNIVNQLYSNKNFKKRKQLRQIYIRFSILVNKNQYSQRRKGIETVLVYQVTITKYTTGGLKQQKLIFSQFWRVGSPRSRCQLITFLLRPLPGLQMATFSLCPQVAFPQCVHVDVCERGESSFLLLIRPPIGLGLVLMTSINFNYLLRAPSELPLWSSSKESAFQCRGHGFNPWSGN